MHARHGRFSNIKPRVTHRPSSPGVRIGCSGWQYKHWRANFYHWPRNLERLEPFLRTLPKNRLHTIEFRDPTWYVDATVDLLSRYRAALCLHDMAGSATGRHLVGPFVYLRLHGPQRYAGRYPGKALEAWAEWCASRQREGLDVFVYFNNDAHGHAPRDALRMRELCARYDTVHSRDGDARGLCLRRASIE